MQMPNQFGKSEFTPYKALVADINLWRHLAERLSMYAKHTHWCPFMQDEDCQCGLKKLRQELETARWGTH